MNLDINNYPLWTAIVTPMNLDSSIDYDSLKDLLLLQEKAGNAIVVLGSTGEALNLSRNECKKVLEFTMKLNLKVPVMTGVPGFNLEDSLNYIEYLNCLNLSAYLMVTPLYAKPGDVGQTEWFKALLNKSKRPVMLYNVPGRTAVKMSFKAVSNLAGHPNFWAIKEASGSVLDFIKYGKANPKAKMFSGDDGMMEDFKDHRLSGLVSVASNIWPSETNLYVKKALSKSLTKEEVSLWKSASDSLFIASNPVPVKNILWATKLIKNKTMRAPLSDRDLVDNSPLLLAHTKIKEWFSRSN